MPNRSTVTFLYDGSFEGLLTAVFDSYTADPPQQIQSAVAYQPTFEAAYSEIETDPDKARRVIQGVYRRMGRLGYRKIWQAFLYSGDEKATAIYRYIRLGMSEGLRIHRQLTHPTVLAMDKLCALTGREATAFTQFVRFSETANRFYYARIEPEHCVLPLIMPHFVARMNTTPFLIHDVTHHLAGVYDTRRWHLASTDEWHAPALSETEQAYRALWRGFYEAVSIQERCNPALRRQLMPKKYWKNLTELQPPGSGYLYVSPAAALKDGLSSARIAGENRPV